MDAIDTIVGIENNEYNIYRTMCIVLGEISSMFLKRKTQQKNPILQCNRNVCRLIINL